MRICKEVVLVAKWDDNLISRIQQANDIVDVVSEYLSLTKRGKEWVGLCPFHTDHRPSLYVSPTKQIFKCFACGAGGDVLKFVQMKENLTFIQAVERLAQRVGISLEGFKRRRAEQNNGTLSPTELAKLNTWAMKHWVANLWDKTQGAAAREYLARRKISQETARTWQMGFAPDSWDDLLKKAAQENIPEHLLVESGLAVRRENTSGCYDKFRNRLMFPIADVTGRIAGFGGRTLGQDPAKYMNSPATALFDKSQLLYGLRQGREAIVKAGRAVVVEGYTDVLMAHQNGIKTVVAALGTSLTQDHTRVLRRYADRIILVFDSDAAGRSAAGRALEVCLSGKVDIRLAFVPEGKDPCDFLVEHGPAAFETVIEAAEDVLSFKWRQLNEQMAEQDSLPKQTETVGQFLQTVAAAVQAGQTDPLELAVLIGRLSALLQTPKSRIDEQLQRLLKQKPPVERTQQGSSETRTSDVDDQTAVTKARREILEVLIQEPGLYATVFGRFTLADFGSAGPMREIAEAILPSLEAGQEPQTDDLYRRIESPQTAAILTEMTFADGSKGPGARRLVDALEVLEVDRHRRDIESHKTHLTDDAVEPLQRIYGFLKQQKGNPRCGGLQ